MGAFRLEAELCGNPEALRRTFRGSIAQNHAVAIHRLGRKEARKERWLCQRFLERQRQIKRTHVYLQVGHRICEGMPPPRLRRSHRRIGHHAALRRKAHGQPSLSALRLDLAATVLHPWPQGIAETSRQKERVEFPLCNCFRLCARRSPQEIHIVKNRQYGTVRFYKQAAFQGEHPKKCTDKISLSSSFGQGRDGSSPPADYRGGNPRVQTVG